MGMLKGVRKMGSGASKFGRDWRVTSRSAGGLDLSVLIDIREMLEEIDDRQRQILAELQRRDTPAG
ncbi:hypothetical protein FHE66_02765 [Georgenia sp. 311]|uniref:hypothetical protein n=1 Tax=Georgenia sp. 311 TaxID=2585134 RepID=UPI001111B271|nr:hypothetical protein [Georgenia sp. 311]TNC19783.1 hypothetical protein FHE66_02765 [Georgenia sp. 311]